MEHFLHALIISPLYTLSCNLCLGRHNSSWKFGPTLHYETKYISTINQCTQLLVNTPTFPKVGHCQIALCRYKQLTQSSIVIVSGVGTLVEAIKCKHSHLKNL